MRAVVSLALGLLAVAAGPAAAADQTVNVANNAFDPTTVNVVPGDTVTWRFTGGDLGNHSITAEDGSFDSDRGNNSPQHAVGFEYRNTFGTAGSFKYFCKIHSFMRGTVVVATPGGEPDVAEPVVSSLKATQSRTRVTVKFRLDEDAAIAGKLKLAKSTGRGGKTSKNVKLAGERGSNSLRIPFKGLRTGRYRLSLTATDAAGNKSDAATVAFTIPRAE
jgi:plastocyanin